MVSADRSWLQPRMWYSCDGVLKRIADLRLGLVPVAPDSNTIVFQNKREETVKRVLYGVLTVGRLMVVVDAAHAPDGSASTPEESHESRC